MKPVLYTFVSVNRWNNEVWANTAINNATTTPSYQHVDVLEWDEVHW